MPLPCPGPPESPVFLSLRLHTEDSAFSSQAQSLKFTISSITSSWERRGGGGVGWGQGSAQDPESAERIFTLVAPHPTPLLFWLLYSSHTLWPSETLFLRTWPSMVSPD